MALVVIQVQDMPDGSTGVNVTMEPRMVGPRSKFTTAEKLGAAALNAIHNLLDGETTQLIIAGADELPH